MDLPPFRLQRLRSADLNHRIAAAALSLLEDQASGGDDGAVPGTVAGAIIADAVASSVLRLGRRASSILWLGRRVNRLSRAPAERRRAFGGVLGYLGKPTDAEAEDGEQSGDDAGDDAEGNGAEAGGLLVEPREVLDEPGETEGVRGGVAEGRQEPEEASPQSGTAAGLGGFVVQHQREVLPLHAHLHKVEDGVGEGEDGVVDALHAEVGLAEVARGVEFAPGRGEGGEQEEELKGLCAVGGSVSDRGITTAMARMAVGESARAHRASVERGGNDCFL